MSSSAQSLQTAMAAVLRRRERHILSHREARRASKHRAKRCGDGAAVVQLFAPDAAPRFLSLHTDRKRPRSASGTESAQSRTPESTTTRGSARRRRAPARTAVSVALAARQDAIRQAYAKPQSPAVDALASDNAHVRPTTPRVRRWTRARRRACLCGVVRPARLRRYWCDAAAAATEAAAGVDTARRVTHTSTWSAARRRRRRVLRRALRQQPCVPGDGEAHDTMMTRLRYAEREANVQLWYLVWQVRHTRVAFVTALAVPCLPLRLAHAFPLAGMTVRVHRCHPHDPDAGAAIADVGHGMVLYETLTTLGVVLLPGAECVRACLRYAMWNGAWWGGLRRVAPVLVHAVRLFPASSGTRTSAERVLAARLPAWRETCDADRPLFLASVDNTLLEDTPSTTLQVLHNRYL